MFRIIHFSVMEHKGGVARWAPGRANVVELITDANKPLAYRLLAWHGTMLVAFNS